MIDISGLPNVDPATANLINGEMVDVTTPGDGTGTPVRKDWQSDLYYALIAIMNEAGITADDTAEGATSSQVKDAILRVARRQVQGPSYSNLLVKRNAGTPNSKVDVTFGKLWIEGIEKTTGSYTLDITASGALGLDTGAEAADAWYYIWVIAKADGTVSALLSASSTAPTLPAGYIYKRLVSMVYNSSGSNFVDFLQQDRHWFYKTQQTYRTHAAPTSEVFDASQYIPEKVYKTYQTLLSGGSDAGVDTKITAQVAGYVNLDSTAIQLQTVSRSVTGKIGEQYNSATVITTIRQMSLVSARPAGGTTIYTVEFYINGFEVPL